MKRFKKFFTLFLGLLLFCLCIGTTVYAAETTAVLTKDMSISYSGTLSAAQCKYRGSNNESSKYSVYAIVKYKTLGVYITDAKISMEPGTSFSYLKTSELSSNHTWRMTLNPKGTNNSECIAHGRLTTVK